MREAQRRSGRRAVPSTGRMGVDDAEAMMARFAAADAMYGAQ